MGGLYSIPQEVLIEILANCESPRMVAKFAATCKLVNSTWVSFAPSILKRIGRKSILYYDTALVVVRATNIVRAAFEAGELPPHISPFDPDLRQPGPSAAEYRQILDNEKLVNFVEEWFLRQVDADIAVRPRPFCSMDIAPPDRRRKAWGPPILHLSCRDRIQRTMYRLMLAGAVCSRAYNEPFWADDAPLVFRDGFRTSRKAGWMAPEDFQPVTLTRADLAYLRSFAAFSPKRTGVSRDSAFPQTFGEWFAWDVTRCFLQEKQREDYRPHTDISLNEFAKAEISSMNIVLLAFRQMVVNADGSDRSLRTLIREPHVNRQRKISIVVFGVFQPEEMTLPPTIPDLQQPWLIASPVCAPASSASDVGGMFFGQEKVSPGVHCDIAKIVRKVYPKGENDVAIRDLERSPPPYCFLDRSLLRTLRVRRGYDIRDLYRVHAAFVDDASYEQPSFSSRFGASRNRSDGWRQMRYPTGLPPALMYGVSWDDSSAS